VVFTRLKIVILAPNVGFDQCVEGRSPAPAPELARSSGREGDKLKTGRGIAHP